MYMFHQVHVLPEDKAVTYVVGGGGLKGLNREETHSIYEWQVFPYGSTCGPLLGLRSTDQI